MAKSKKEENLDPFAGFRPIKGEFVVNKSEDDDFEEGDKNLIKDEEDSDEKKRMLEADKLLEKQANKIAKKTKDESEKEDEEEDENDDSKESSGIREFTKVLHNKGVIDFDDTDEEFEESEEGIEKLVSKTVENRINKWVSALPDEYSKFLDFVQNGGNPKDFLNIYYGNHSWENFNIDNENKQVLAVEESLRLAGETDEDIQDIVTEWKDNGTLEKRAKSALTKLQKYEVTQKTEIVNSQKELKDKKIKQEKEEFENFKNNFFKKEEIKGFKLTPKIKETVWNHLTVVDKKTGKTAYQEALEKDEEASLLFALQSAMGFNMEKLEKQVETKISKKFGDMLKNYSKSSKEKISSGVTEEKDEDSPFAGFKKIITK
jgi:hypothetical protein